MSARGTLVSSALLQLRDTPDRDNKLFPAKTQRLLAKAGNMWMNLVDARETAQARRAKHSEKKWSEHTRALVPLKVGDTVMVQSPSSLGQEHEVRGV